MAVISITPALLREWEACWTDEDIAEHYAGREMLTPRQIAEDTTISRDDRLWVLSRTLWHLDENAARTCAIDSAALVSHLAGREQDQAEHARLVADLRRIYAIPAGPERDRELQRWDAARDAAWAAARDAAWATAWAAAWDAARAAAWAAARDAARAAARAAARDAARAAAWAAEIDKAIQRALLAIEAL